MLFPLRGVKTPTEYFAAAMHDLDPTFRKWSRSALIAEALADLGYQCPLPVQSMYICKVPSSTS